MIDNILKAERWGAVDESNRPSPGGFWEDHPKILDNPTFLQLGTATNVRSEAQKLKTNGFFFGLDFAKVLDVLFF